MAGSIQLLPDSIANQIAAGEVIQRPASVLKELMENAIDAGSTEVQIILKDAGKTLVQVNDNGTGMSVADARMSFERHATSKIRKASDLFQIETKGFRGEALPSIAAIAHVEMRTRPHTDDLGTLIKVHGSKVLKQEPCQCPPGTQVAVKNLFYNVPARRKFLKSDPVELKHLMQEFVHIALAHPEVAFELFHNDNEIHRLPKANLRQRIVAIQGKKANTHLVPVEEETKYLKISGYVGKPDFAKKRRGDQYLLVNQRFIRNGYLHHAIKMAYEDMITTDYHPFYVLYLDLDPKHIDINVHPTKQEIKFEDQRLVYNYLRVAVRHALGKYSVTPSLDFDQEVGFGREAGKKPGGQTQDRPGEDVLSRQNLARWEEMFAGMDHFQIDQSGGQQMILESGANRDGGHATTVDGAKKVFQIHAAYLISQIKSGIVMVDQQAAHERVLYEEFLSLLKNSGQVSQKALFPVTIELPAHDAEILKNVLPMIQSIGFDIQDFGQNTFIIHGKPANLEEMDEVTVIRHILDQVKSEHAIGTGVAARIAKAMAMSTAVRRGKALTDHEAQNLIDKLFACENPFKSPSGRKCFITLELDELQKRFTE